MDREMPNVDVLSLQSLHGEGAKIVTSTSPHEDDAGASSRGRHRLIRTLASGGALEGSAQQRFSGLRKALANDDQICIRAAEEQHLWCKGHAGVT